MTGRSGPLPTGQLDTQCDAAYEHSEEPNSKEHEADGQEGLSVPATRLGKEEAADDGCDKATDGLQPPGRVRRVTVGCLHLRRVVGGCCAVQDKLVSARPSCALSAA